MRAVNLNSKVRRCALCAPPATRSYRAAVLLLAACALAPFAAGAASGQVTVIHNFGATSPDGEFPVSSLVPASDGNLYGVTNGGGVIGAGAVIRLARDGTVSLVYSFGTAYYPLDDDGRAPYGDLLAHADGFLYGTTAGGGVHNRGSVFRVSQLGAYQKLYDFGSIEADGLGPNAGLVEGADGGLYGTTVRGGSFPEAHTGGAIYRISTSGEYSLLYSFGASTQDGSWPYAGLTRGNDGNLYGATYFSPFRIGMEGGGGTIFRYSSEGSATRIYEFNTTGNCPDDGAAPATTMILGSDGSFYGTTDAGGVYSRGSIFRVTPSGDLAVLYSFGSIEGDGREPRGRLLQLDDGTLLGTTRFGGEHETETNYGGTVFMLEPDGTYTRLYSFGATPTDGQWVQAGLTRGVDGHFYGTTARGGTTSDPDLAGVGTLFRLMIDPEGTAPSFKSAPRTCPVEVGPGPDTGSADAGGFSSLPLLVLGLAGLWTRRRPSRSGSSVAAAGVDDVE